MALEDRDDGADELVVRARGGDGAAWARLVERYSGLLWSVARSYGLNESDAGDVVQTTWLRLVERIDGLAEPAATGRWLAVTARRESLRVARSRGRELPGALADTVRRSADGRTADGEACGPERVFLARERLGQVAAALEALPHRCRHLLRLCAVAPSHAALAAALGIPVGSVGPTRARCLDTLARRLTR
ncbi:MULTISPECIES: RNA polymerase sigma factor [Thermomonosporaceae]|uniref:RNA polymerase sigma factor n=1 Tax=Thermomonosporaceae TaxID=2012 RepID=UPI00255A939E|nr:MULTISPECIES: sigma-70 family RNA polymerase sigma factor [Thermomonosporaceae]MDL4775081.1 sigma-70 family RNA polymerase sigma factor [Actinomadura xylanilytica]